MSLLDRVLARLRPAPVEQRRVSGYLGTFAAGPHVRAVNYASTILAENLSTVTACIELISSTIAALPALVYRARPGGQREEAPSHPLALLIAHGVNDRMTWFAWVQWTLGQLLLHGNALSVIERDGEGQVVALWPVPWLNVSVGVTPSGQLLFDVSNIVAPWASYGERRRYLAAEVLLIALRSDDGFLGRSPISRAAGVVQNAHGIQVFSNSVWDRAAIPSGVLKHPGVLSQEAKDNISRGFSQRFAGAANAGGVPVLEENMSWEASAMSPEDAEVLASRRFQGEELARLFNVPPPLIGDLTHGTFTNTETAGRFFAQFCIAQHVRRIESEFSRQVFAGDGFHLVLDTAGMQRGDEAGRWATYDIALRNKVLTISEIRQAEGWAPQPDTPDEFDPRGHRAMMLTWMTFERAHRDDGSPVSRREALSEAMVQLIEANAADPHIGGALLLLDTGERIEIDLARAGRA